MKRFAQASNHLKVKKLTENIRMGSSPKSVDDLDNKDDFPNESIHKEDEDQTQNECAGKINLYISDKSKSRG